jgi:hypothetical protein
MKLYEVTSLNGRHFAVVAAADPEDARHLVHNYYDLHEPKWTTNVYELEYKRGVILSGDYER